MAHAKKRRGHRGSGVAAGLAGHAPAPSLHSVYSTTSPRCRHPSAEPPRQRVDLESASGAAAELDL